jgi:hypothetical protein
LRHQACSPLFATRPQNFFPNLVNDSNVVPKPEWFEALLAKDKLLGPLTKQYGAEQVWNVGIEVLGYAPTLQHSIGEVMRVVKRLEELNPQK